jgi:Zn-dependent alcohol dehydrogenase
MMPQVLMLALIGALGVVAARTLMKTQERAAVRLKEAERAMARQPGATLVQDPVTGIYRPRDRA